MYNRLLLVIVLLFLIPGVFFGQTKKASKYPSLLWEISGNGLEKPSYLFGTMHVSNKMVFHLSDSFYYALKSVDVVALELNPDVWQGEMVRLEKLKQNYQTFSTPPQGDYLTENSFKIDNYADELKAAISTEPAVVNSLLYRTYKAKEDFEEDTFLDLYIFQTGRKLGKRASGVENYYEAEKLMMEAYTEMAKEKLKKNNMDPYDESLYDIEIKIQEAYRKNDLDLLDSLDKKAEQSAAFREKFLYQRNDIQANSIDTILKKNSLFVGVGAAHLPGERGVIELLRKKGYRLRPIKMMDRDAYQKEKIDNMKVPVAFQTQQSEDGFYQVSVPGILYNLKEAYQQLDRKQFSDMSNGSYYLVTRVKTHAAFLGQTEKEVLKKVDSLLYENIPGKIISKKAIVNNGYQGLDVLNKTRRGDLQRYNIFVTPYEVIIFKMSGKENYVSGSEAESFFSSVQLKNKATVPQIYEPAGGGFSILFPQQPLASMDKSGYDDKRWEYEAADKLGGTDYLLVKKMIRNYSVLEADTFDLKLMEESFRGANFFDKQVSRKYTLNQGFPCLEVVEKLKDGATVFAKYIINGPEYYVLAARTKAAQKTVSPFFDSFKFIPYRYPSSQRYIDTFMNFSANTFVQPTLDEGLRKASEEAAQINWSPSLSYWKKSRNGYFEDNNTGEAINVFVESFPKYFAIKDSAKFWKGEMESYLFDRDLMLHKKEVMQMGDSVYGVRFSLRDTGSSRQINRMLLLKDNMMYRLVSVTDTANSRNGVVDSFYHSFSPLKTASAMPIVKSRAKEFFRDLFSTDSTTQEQASQAITSIDFDEKDVPDLIAGINRLSISNKNYFDTKARLIAALGSISDTSKPVIVSQLGKLYEQTADTSRFQNQIIKTLLQQKTTASYALLQDLVLKDPPVLDNSYDYTNFFSSLSDSLELSKKLFPGFLQLTVLDDYKPVVIELLAKLLDSGYVHVRDYEEYFPKIYFDAKVELKKQRVRDEKQMENDLNKDEANGADNYNRFNAVVNNNLYNEGVLLVPFYDKNPSVKKMFDQLVLSKDINVQLTFATLLLKNNKPVSDSIFDKIAEDNLLRSQLFSSLEKIKRLDRFPVKYKKQQEIAKAFLWGIKGYTKIDSIAFVGTENASYQSKNGIVYCFKYRTGADGDWKIAISGLFSSKKDELGSDNTFTELSETKLKNDEPIFPQFQNQLKRILFSLHKGGKYFYRDKGGKYNDADYDD